MTAFALIGGGVLILGLLVFLYGKAQREKGALEVQQKQAEKNAEVAKKNKEAAAAIDEEIHEDLEKLESPDPDVADEWMRDFWSGRK